jgi:hypothetical protein
LYSQRNYSSKIKKKRHFLAGKRQMEVIASSSFVRNVEIFHQAEERLHR